MKVWGKFLILMLLSVLIASVSVAAGDKETFSTTPKTYKGKVWRIGYYEGGEYIDYQKIFTETVRGLMRLGWIETTVIPPQKGEQTKDLWNWLATNAISKYIRIVKDAHYSARWDDKLRQKTVSEIINRLNSRHDIDLMIGMGTWAGKDLANETHQIPTMVLSASDAVASGIIKSAEDSGYDHVHACVDPFRYERQVRVFHDIVGFKKLGVAYEDSVEGKSYAAVEIIEKVAAERDFKIVKCFTKSDIADTGLAEQSVKDCFGNLSQNADAIYVTVQGGVSLKSIPDLVRIANSHGIPTFSQSGSEEVKYGFLMSISQAGFKYVGQFQAETLGKVFNGATPRQLNQIFEEPKKIAINLKTAKAVGFDPPIDVLGAADEIYEEIVIPD
ncbi:MAG: ABC transporter substrate-binding protein [Deltaproteobacteria bacterium]|nr:ABC transporter substrate-binding protein [Deltaproteobacteria bacterium]